MTYQERFKAFLASALKFDSEENRNRIVADAEDLMTDFIRAKVDPAFALYAVEGDASKGDWYLKLRQRLSVQPSLAAGFDGARLKAVLKHYANFVKSKTFLSNKVTLAAGELALKSAVKKKARGTDGGHGATALPVVLEEGEIKEMHIAKCERNPKLRKACIEYYRAQNEGRIACAACGMAFGDVYGEIGEGYIEVHHLSPISQIEGVHTVDPKTDLVPLCANCHAMIHRLMAAEKKMAGKELEGTAALAKLKWLLQGHAPCAPAVCL